jgi:hypothetical protein
MEWVPDEQRGWSDDSADFQDRPTGESRYHKSLSTLPSEYGTQSQTAYLGRIKLIPVLAVCYWLAMLVTGTDLVDASLLTTAIVFGLLSIGAAGGIKTAPGLLNFVMILKFVLIAVTLKALTWQASDSILRAPHTTCEVMAVGFFALYLGSWLYRYTTKIKGLVTDVTDSQLYLVLTIVFSLACLGSTIAILIFQTSYDKNLSGGLWGIAHQFEVTTSFCVVPAMYYAWSSGSKQFLSHPLVLTILMVELALGVALTTKQGMMEPMLCYLSVGFIRYGWRSKAVWGIVGFGTLCYLLIVYPYSQYVRNHGGRDGSLQERLQAIQEVFFSVSTDSEFRDVAESSTAFGESYLGKESLRPISRFAMIGEADRLIAATDEMQSYTGWETITDGLQLMVPSFLLPDKSLIGGGNFLGRIAGDVASDDLSTQISYGIMANFYNAFGLTGVLLGTTIFIAIFFYVLRIWFATPDLSFGPWGSSIWYLLLSMLFEHSLVEAPVGNILPGLINLSAVVALVFASKFLLSILRKRQSPGVAGYYQRSA